MKYLLDILRCPTSGQKLIFTSTLESSNPDSGNKFVSGILASEDGKYKYKITNGIPSFIEDSDTDSFGFQWSLYQKTQLDSFSGHNISESRFWQSTRWTPSELKDKLVLDVGCGSGRFSEIALNAGARVVAIDSSQAVDACLSNFPNNPNILIVRADIFSLPFDLESFDYIFSLGVIQHTIDPEKAFKSLIKFLNSDGKLCIDCYEKKWNTFILPKYLLRPLTKRVSNENLFSILKFFVAFLLSCSNLLSKVPIIGSFLKKIVPIANYHGILPLSKEQHIDWALLDTFDWLTPKYDYPQTYETVKKWLSKSGLKDTEVIQNGHLIARGRKIRD